MPENICQQLKQDYEKLKALKTTFDLAYKGSINAKNPNDLTEAKALKEQLEEQYNLLLEKLMIIHRRYYYPRELNNVEEKENYHEVEMFEGHAKSVRTLQVLPDGKIVSGSDDKTIKVWEKDKQGKYKCKCIDTLEGHTSRVLTLQVLPDGRIVSGSGDGAIVIWDGIKKATN